MKIYLDLSFVPSAARNEILSAISGMSHRVVTFNEFSMEEVPQYVEFEFTGSVADFEDTLRSSLERKTILDYVVAQDSQKENTFTLLKSVDLEQLQIYFCDFCGAFFNSEEGKYLHERAHYFY